MTESQILKFMQSQADLNKSLLQIINNQEQHITLLKEKIEEVEQNYQKICTPSPN